MSARLAATRQHPLTGAGDQQRGSVGAEACRVTRSGVPGKEARPALINGCGEGQGRGALSQTGCHGIPACRRTFDFMWPPQKVQGSSIHASQLVGVFGGLAGEQRGITQKPRSSKRVPTRRRSGSASAAPPPASGKRRGTMAAGDGRGKEKNALDVRSGATLGRPMKSRRLGNSHEREGPGIGRARTPRQSRKRWSRRGTAEPP